MWNAYRHRVCAGSCLQQTGSSCESLQVRLCYHDNYTLENDLFLVVVALSFSMPDSSVKKQAQDRPMSMWISSIKQLEPVRHLLSPLLLDFMEAAWPSSISMVIPRGSLRTSFVFAHDV